MENKILQPDVERSTFINKLDEGFLLADGLMRKGMNIKSEFISGENEAFFKLLGCIAQGGNFVVIGPSGTDKTVLLRNSWRLIDGISSENVADMPPDLATQALHVTGGYMETKFDKKINDEEESSEIKKTHIKGIINPDLTRVLTITELSRIGGDAQNAILDILEDNKMVVGSKTYDLNILLKLAAMNPTAARDNTTKLDRALINRFEFGAFVGYDTEEIKRETDKKLLNGELCRPEKIRPITTIDELKVIQNAAKLIVINKRYEDLYLEKLSRAKKFLKEHLNNNEGGRMAVQVGKNARTFSLIRGDAFVSPKSFDLALDSVVTSRIGGNSNLDNLDSSVDMVKNLMDYVKEAA